MTPTTVVFDLGGVLVEWDPRLLYRRLLATDDEVEAFLDEIDFHGWNHAQDAGEHTWAEAVELLAARHPRHRELIAAYPARFTETLGGPIQESVALVRTLRDADVRLLALTNWSAELFAVARPQLGFLDLFEAVVVSGEEGVAKPDPAIFELLVRRHALEPASTVFVDDREANVDAAAAAGLTPVLFTDPAALRRDLTRLGLNVGGPPG